MVRRDVAREYVGGSLWVLPSLAAIGALIIGSVLSFVDVGPDSPLVFQGTSADARALLIGITGTMVTVIALLLGLAVVALQLSSTQFSPRLLRNFLRDRPNQVVLSVFVGTFAYSAAGLYTVGVAGGQRSEEFPRLAVTVATVLLFVSLSLLVFFADHLAHSIQVDTIMRVVERNTIAAVRAGSSTSDARPGAVPTGAVSIAALGSGYVQDVDVEHLNALAHRERVCIRLLPRVGEHVVATTSIGWVWPAPGESAPNPEVVAAEVHRAVRLGFERTVERDPAFGIQQLCDIACKALSPAVNDPYTAIQAVDHLTVVFCSLARQPLGARIEHDDDTGGEVTVPGWRFSQYLAVGCGLIRRYGCHEPSVAQALLRLLTASATFTRDLPQRQRAIEEQAALIVAEAERQVQRQEDLAPVYLQAQALRHALSHSTE